MGVCVVEFPLFEPPFLGEHGRTVPVFEHFDRFARSAGTDQGLVGFVESRATLGSDARLSLDRSTEELQVRAATGSFAGAANRFVELAQGLLRLGVRTRTNRRRVPAGVFERPAVVEQRLQSKGETLAHGSGGFFFLSVSPRLSRADAWGESFEV